VDAWRVFAQGVGALVVGASAAIATVIADTERIGTIWTSAAFDADGTAAIVEVIDYDFGRHSRHGIIREIEDLDPASRIEVSSPDAPDQVSISAGLSSTDLRIGDPDKTVKNRRRYRIAYPLDSLAVPAEGLIRWDAVGTSWRVSVRRAEIHVVAPFELESPRCFKGSSGSVDSCTVTQPEPGRLSAVVTGLGSFQGATIEAVQGDALGQAPALPPEPVGSAQDPGWWWLWAGLLGFGIAFVPTLVVWPVMRYRGREQVWGGGAVSGAFGPRDGETAPVVLLHPEQLAELATIEFAAPPRLSATAGGIVHAEAVLDRHKVAWLIERAIADELVIDEQVGDNDNKDDDAKVVTLRRGTAPPHPAVAADLEAIFDGRDSVTLGEYDKKFAAAWAALGSNLTKWRDASGLWDPAAEKRHSRALAQGFLLLLFGLAGVITFSVFASRSGGRWIVAALAAMLLGGFGIAWMTGASELTVRTPQGSARYLQVESFRRFIAGSEAHHAAAAARMGLLRHLTAWAVALDELDHWNAAVAAAALDPGSGVDATTFSALSMTTIAPTLSSSVSSASTAPSSSSGAGSFSGGGGGGGGGGSW
jgi:uncharacterized membrane protein YgcG